MAAGRSSGWLVFTLAILAAIAAAELHYGVGRGGGGPPTSAASAPDMAPPTPLFALADQETFTETLVRPLFMPNRRPADVETPTAAAPTTPTVRPDAARYALSAIVIVDDERTALVTDTTTGTLSRVREGERLAGWRVEAIRDDGAVLSDGDDRAELSLRVFGPPAPVAPRSKEPAGRTRDAAPQRLPDRPRRPRRGPRAASPASRSTDN